MCGVGMAGGAETPPEELKQCAGLKVGRDIVTSRAPLHTKRKEGSGGATARTQGTEEQSLSRGRGRTVAEGVCVRAGEMDERGERGERDASGKKKYLKKYSFVCLWKGRSSTRAQSVCGRLGNLPGLGKARGLADKKQGEKREKREKEALGSCGGEEKRRRTVLS